MRIFNNFDEARNEIARDLKEMGLRVDNVTMQDKHGSFPTLELINYGYTVTSPRLGQLHPVMPWAAIEWQDRLRAILGDVSMLGNSWRERADDHIDWAQFLEYNGSPIPDGVSLEELKDEYPAAANDPLRLAYSYGERLALNDQVFKVIRELRENPTSRQLYVAMWDPHQDIDRVGYRRVPCSIGWHFLLRNGNLNLTYTMRSCDFVTHWQNDVWLAMNLLYFVCEKTGTNPGHFSQFINSFHVYEKDVADVF